MAKSRLPGHARSSQRAQPLDDEETIRAAIAREEDRRNRVNEAAFRRLREQTDTCRPEVRDGE